MRKSIRFLFFIGMLAIWSTNYLSAQTTRVVTSNLDNDSGGTLRKIIESANDGDIITFDPLVTSIQLTQASIDISKSITIVGENKVAVKANDWHRIFNINVTGENKNVRIKGLNLIGSYAYYDTKGERQGTSVYIEESEGVEVIFENIAFDYPADLINNGYIIGEGGAIYSEGKNSLSIINCTFSQNISAYDYGGAICWKVPQGYSGAELNISGNTVFKNLVADLAGGAIYIKGNIALKILDNVEFVGNKTDDEWGVVGGAIAIEPADGKDARVDVDISGSVLFDGNQSNAGGAIGLFNDNPATAGEKNINIRIDGATFENNYSSRNGGSIVVGYSSRNGIVDITNSKFTGNKTTDFGGVYTYNTKINVVDSEFSGNECVNYSGAALYSHNGDMTIKGSSFSGNFSKEGGAVAANLDGKLTIGPGSILIEDCTFEDNTARIYGGAVFYTVSGLAGEDRGIHLTLSGENAFKRNKSTTTERSGGGAISLISGAGAKSSLTISGKALFEGNEAVTTGAGIYMVNGSETGSEFIATIDGAEFISNRAEWGGGGIYNHNCLLNLLNSTFTENSTIDTDGAKRGGGAVSVYTGPGLNVTNCTFTGNTSAAGGGAISSPAINNIIKSKFTGNTAVLEGGAINAPSNNADRSLTVEDCTFTNNTSDSKGGAIHSKSPTVITKSVFDSNIATQNKNAEGGALGMYAAFTASIKECVFNKNKAHYGGAIRTSSGVVMNIDASSFNGNNATGWGGGVLFSLGTLDITNENGVPTSFTSNTASTGGGLAAQMTTVTLTDVQFGGDEKIKGNVATGDGGAILNYGSDVTMLRGYMRGNTARGGGAIHSWADGNKTQLTYVVVQGNTSTGGQGAVYMRRSTSNTFVNVLIADNIVENGTGGGLHNSEATTLLTNVTISNNKAADASGIYNSASSSSYTTDLTLRNTVVWGDGSGTENLVTLEPIVYEYSIVEGIANTQDGNLDGTNSTNKPLFTNTYALYTTSPGVDAGNKSYPELATIAYDLAGNARIIGDKIDMGAFETKANDAPIPPIPPIVEPPVPPVPEPEWPVPPLPDPNPDHPITDACYSDEFFNIVLWPEYTGDSLLYAVAFTETSKAAGFADIKTYKELPKGSVVSISIPTGVKAGSYSGYLLIRERNSVEYGMYAFTVTIKDGVTIIKQPQPITQQTNGEWFTLSVEAQGGKLTYQWFYNGERIEGANSSTYKDIYSADKEGLYYVEIYGDCGWIQSDEVMVTGCFGVLMKWDDVMYVQNTDNRYVKFQWYQDGYAIPVNGNSIYYTNPKGLTSSYYVRAYYEDGTYDQSCTINFGPKDNSLSIQVKWEDVLYIVNENQNYVKYQWYKDSEPIWENGNDAYYTNTEGLLGIYYVKAYHTDGTYDESNRLSFETLTRSSSFSIYPAIVEKSNYIYVESNELGASNIGALIELYDISGRKIHTSTANSAKVEIPMNIPGGNYILQVVSPNGKRTVQKVFVK